MKLELIATTTFGLEAVVRREAEGLGFRILKVEDGRVIFEGDERALVRANLWLRCADRVQILMGRFRALEFEDLFQQMKGIAWEEWIPMDGRFVVNGSSVKSKLSSVPACQSVAEKALVERLREFYGVERFSKSGALYDVKVSLLKDEVTVTLDTTGAGLHKRGYRQQAVTAPIKETLAAAMIQLSFWNPERLLLDPCCGSGTIAIEAAMIGRNMAPGLGRSFAAEEWEAVPERLWREERKKAFNSVAWDRPLKIYASDIDPEAVSAAKENAAEAGVADDIEFIRADGAKAANVTAEQEGGIIITNPPYGYRIGDRKSMDRLYEGFAKFLRQNPTWSMFVITADKEAEQKLFGRPADRRRKLFNGRMEVCYYQYHGRKPRGEAGSGSAEKGHGNKDRQKT